MELTTFIAQTLDECKRRPLPDDFTLSRMFRQLIGEENQHFGQMPICAGLQRGLDK